jgi:hypothetical protein
VSVNLRVRDEGWLNSVERRVYRGWKCIEKGGKIIALNVLENTFLLCKVGLIKTMEYGPV